MTENITKIEDSFIIAEKILRKIAFNDVKKVESRFHGDFRSIFQGHGLDFREIRGYSTNDDIRNIDWNVTARMGKPYVRVYEEERNNTVWMVFDTSSSMNFGSKFITKKDVMIKFAAITGYLANKRGDKTGAVFFSDKIENIIPPEKGLKHIYKIIKMFLSNEDNKNHCFNADFSSLSGIIGKKKSIVFMSDFIFPDGDWEREFGKLGVKNELIPVYILDPAEEKLPSVGYINLYDSETGKNIVLDTSNTTLAEKYQQLVDMENEKINKIFSVLNLNPVKIYTDSDIAKILINYINKNRR